MVVCGLFQELEDQISKLLLLPLLKLLQTERARVRHVELRHKQVKDLLGCCEGLVCREERLPVPRLLDGFCVEPPFNMILNIGMYSPLTREVDSQPLHQSA